MNTFHSHASRKPSRGGSFGGGRKPFSGGRGRGGPRGEYIHESRFINKTEPAEEAEVFVPQNKFSDFAISEPLKASIQKKGYHTPTPIQDQAIPQALLGKDVLGIANTGTGKTGAFLIPLIDKMHKDPRTRMLVIVPTRELALQVHEEFRALAQPLSLYSVCVVGGASMGKQLSDLRRPYNAVIGTPGRLKDLVKRKALRLSDFGTVVLDEADRMLDMGFVHDMREVVAGMPKDRQTLFFSATLSSAVQKIVNEFLTDPIHISVKKRDTSKSVHQDIVRVPAGVQKTQVLYELLLGDEFQKVLVFGGTKHGVERLSQTLSQLGIESEAIHGNKNHNQRQRALGKFKNNQARVLVATDVAARGLDIADVTHVINYDLPQTYDDYVHRIGRTGRGGKKGKALTLIEGPGARAEGRSEGGRAPRSGASRPPFKKRSFRR